MTEGRGKQRINGEAITGIALVFLALLFIWAATQNAVWASIVLAAYILIPIGIGFIIVGAVAIRRANTPESERKGRY
jgi:flagellar biosynthesis/type III secretory pathway M-ring protein FliF/YscJ